LDLHIPPAYCQYATGECDQNLVTTDQQNVFFAYPSEPTNIAATIEAASEVLKSTNHKWNWLPWKILPIPGQIIFCEICKSMRNSVAVVCDVTTLNFNVLFELGYAIGLGLPVVPIRDTSYTINRRDFSSLSILDTLGYIDFANSSHLREQLTSRLPTSALPEMTARINMDTPLYLLKGPIETEGVLQLTATLKKAHFRFRAYDPIETPRLSLQDGRRQVASSAGVIANLLDPNRSDALVHNGRCAVICGMAMAQQKIVVMLQEGDVAQPVDYRDIVKIYRDHRNIPKLLEPSLRSVMDAIQSNTSLVSPHSTSFLHEVDLGDVAAENEISGLRSYFVPTGPSLQARNGHPRLVIGRKGSGKTAIFYDVRQRAGRGNERLVLDLKPEGHQFTHLKDFVLERVAPGLREHTMVAFWNYILLCELARKALDKDRNIARVDPDRYQRYKRLAEIYEHHDSGWDADFSQRLVRQLDRIATQLGGLDVKQIGSRLTEIIYRGDLRELTEAVSEYLRTKESVWILVDNLDKGWPVRGTSETDMLIVRALLDASRKMQRQLEHDEIELKFLVFLRSDIYEHLIRETPDKGKDTAIQLDWEDTEAFEEIVRRRIHSSTGLNLPFRELWPRICDPLIGHQDSFAYFAERTLMRPRDLLQFLNAAIGVAVNRGHNRILSDDIIQAEKSYSRDILEATMFEISDTNIDLEDILYVFHGAPNSMGIDEVRDRLGEFGMPEDKVIELLVWFGFFGVWAPTFPEVKYAHSVHGNIRSLMYPLENLDGTLVVHPAFRAALDMELQ
jgi:hypothetical protein